MTMSAPIARQVWTGRFWDVPPSMSDRPSKWTGVKTTGIAMLDRMAVGRLPCPSTTTSPVRASVATARKGIDSRSKLLTFAAGSVSVFRRNPSLRPAMSPAGSVTPWLMPTVAPGGTRYSFSLKRKTVSRRGAASTKRFGQSTLPMIFSSSSGE